MEKDPIVPGVKPSPEDIELRKRQLQARRQAAQRAELARAKATPAAPAKQTLAIVALVITLIIGALAGFLFMQLQTVQKQLNEANELIVSQGANLKKLNDQLSTTDENANLSVDALKMLVRDNNKEIRKLWDLANKRNRPNISSNTESVTALKKSVASVEKKVASTSQKTTAQVANLKKDMEASVARLSNTVSGLSPDINEAQLRISQNSEAIQVLDAKVSSIKQGGDIGDMRLEMEDIQIRLDRIQNALGTTTAPRP